VVPLSVSATGKAGTAWLDGFSCDLANLARRVSASAFVFYSSLSSITVHPTNFKFIGCIVGDVRKSSVKSGVIWMGVV